MKALKLFTFTLLTGLSVLFFSCDKDDPILTKTDLLTQKTWKLTNLKISGAEIELGDCVLDDIYSFAKPSAYTLDESTAKCDPNDSQITTGTWIFIEKETKIKILFSGLSLFDREIVELTPSALKLKFRFSNSDFEQTYSH
jgi:hypothetical protein